MPWDIEKSCKAYAKKMLIIDKILFQKNKLLLIIKTWKGYDIVIMQKVQM